MAFVLANMPLASEAAALGHTLAAEIGVIAPQADAMRTESLESEGQRGARRLGDVTVVEMRTVSEESEVEGGEHSVGSAKVDLAHKLGRPAQKHREGERGAFIPALCESSQHAGGVSLAMDTEDGVARLVFGKMSTIALGDGEIPWRIIDPIRAQVETDGIQPLGHGAGI